jgi:hypothetical protein
MLEGSCLCGKVAYEIECEPRPIVHCHCETCRKTHGAAFSSVMAVPRKSFKWVRGEGLLRAHESSPGKFRRFCSQCGSHIVAERPSRDVVLIRLGCLETSIVGDVKAHIWRSNAASWYDPKEMAPELSEGLLQK